MPSDEELERFSNTCVRLLTQHKNGAFSTNGAFNDSGYPSHSTSLANSEVTESVIESPNIRFVIHAVNFPLDRPISVQDGAVVENKLFIIDNKNHWVKSYDLSDGRYLYISHRNIIKHPWRLCALNPENKLLLVELKPTELANGKDETRLDPDISQKVLSIMNPDLKKKERFTPDIEGSIWDVTTCSRSGLIYLVMKRGFLYRQVEPQSPKFQYMFDVPGTSVPKIAVCPLSGNIAVACNDNQISVFDNQGNFLWNYPDGPKHHFKRLQSIAFDLRGNLLAVDHHCLQVRLISASGSTLKVLHGRTLKFTRPLYAVPINLDRVAIMAATGEVVVVEGYTK